MFGWFTRKRTDDAKPSLDSLTFDSTGYTLQGEPQPGRVRVWHTPEGDGLGLYFLPVPPDLPENVASDGELAGYYQVRLGDSGGKVVEARLIAGDGPMVRTVLSVPQEPSGRTFIGSLTIPFRDFSFVLKCQCAEGGPTGLKAALLLDRELASRTDRTIEGGRLLLPGFNPDDPKHDAEFPHDPIARARRVLDHLSRSVVVVPAIRKLPMFAFPHYRA